MRRNRAVFAAVICGALVIVCVVIASLSKVGTTQLRAQLPSPQPLASFTATPVSGTAPLKVTFTDTSPGSPTAWQWNFGDGTTGTGKTPSHTYTAVGKYSVTLSVTSAAGKSTMTSQDGITVSAPASQPAWKTIIDDQFNTAGVPSHWLLYSGSYDGDNYSCTAPSQVQVPGDGYMHLKMEYLTSGICGRGWYTGGMQIADAYGGVDQAVTLRWRIVPSADPDVVRSTHIIPMRWVDDPNFAWYQGEADYCEGSGYNGCFAYLHYGPNYQQVTNSYSVDLTQWHTFRIEQRNHQVSVFIDNMTKPVWVYKGNATTIPGAFMRTVLQQSCPLSTGCPPAEYAGDVEDIQIDWITIQNAINSSGNAQSQPLDSAPVQASISAQVNAASPVTLTNALADDSRRRILSGLW